MVNYGFAKEIADIDAIAVYIPTYEEICTKISCVNKIIKTDINTITHYKSRFVSVKNALPEQDEEVIVLVDDLNTSPNYKIAFGHVVDKERFKDYNGWNIPNVVYWFPMPKLPKE